MHFSSLILAFTTDTNTIPPRPPHYTVPIPIPGSGLPHGARPQHNCWRTFAPLDHKITSKNLVNCWGPGFGSHGHGPGGLSGFSHAGPGNGYCSPGFGEPRTGPVGPVIIRGLDETGNVTGVNGMQTIPLPGLTGKSAGRPWKFWGY